MKFVSLAITEEDSNLCLPVANSKGHGVFDEHQSCNRVCADVVVTVDHVVDGDRHTDGAGECQQAHGDDESEPMDLVGCTNTPEHQGGGDDDDAQNEGP